MFLYNRILTFLSTVLILIFLELLLIYPNGVYIIAGVIFLIIYFSILYLTTKKILSKDFWNFLITPLFFLSSGFILLLFLESTIIKHIFIFGLAVIYYLILFNLFSFKFKSYKYQPYALENLFSYINLISAFLFYSSIFCFHLFFNISKLILLPIVFIFTLLLNYQSFWVNKIEFKRSIFFTSIISLIFLELFWAIFYLPTGYFVNAVILVVIYYIIVNISRDYLTDNIGKKQIKKYFYIGVSVLILTLATAQWV